MNSRRANERDSELFSMILSVDVALLVNSLNSIFQENEGYLEAV